MRQALAAPERNTMFNKKDKDPIEPLEGEEVKKKGFLRSVARRRKTLRQKS